MLYTKSPLDKDMEPSFLVRSFYLSSFSLVFPQFKLWESSYGSHVMSKKKKKERKIMPLSCQTLCIRTDVIGVEWSEMVIKSRHT